MLSLPLLLDHQSIGSLNLYSRARHAFGAGEVRQAELFSRPAALRLSHVGIAVHAVDAAEVVGLELQDRATIDQALHARPVPIVNRDHQRIAAVSTVREP